MKLISNSWQEYLQVEVYKKGESDRAHVDYTDKDLMQLDETTLQLTDDGAINREASMIW